MEVLEIGPGVHRTKNLGEKRFYIDVFPRGEKGKIAQADAAFDLPFPDKNFSKVKSTFPDGGLIRAFAGEVKSNVWKESGRVLASDGSIEIVIEKNFISPQTGEVAIASVPEKIAQEAERHGFTADIKRLNKEELKEVETNQPMVYAYLVKEKTSDETPFFRVTARK